MHIREFQEASRRRNLRFPGTSLDWTVLEWAGAMCGEAGEAANVAKKIRSNGLSSELHQALAKELADTVSYAALLAAKMTIDLEAAVREKFNEVSEREGMPDRI